MSAWFAYALLAYCAVGVAVIAWTDYRYHRWLREFYAQPSVKVPMGGEEGS